VTFVTTSSDVQSLLHLFALPSADALWLVPVGLTAHDIFVVVAAVVLVVIVVVVVPFSDVYSLLHVVALPSADTLWLVLVE
jgi:hypothetical protein